MNIKGKKARDNNIYTLSVQYKSMMKAIIFDFDGVIADTERMNFNELNKLLAYEGLRIPNDEFADYIGKKSGAFLRGRFSELTEEKIKKIVTKRRDIVLSNTSSIKLVPGVRELLAYLKNEDYKIAICTGSRKQYVMEILEHNALTEFFNIIVSGEDFSSSKPNPEGFLLATERIGIPKENCIIIEDSPAGVQAANNAGIKSYALGTYFQKDELSAAEKTFSDHLDLLNHLKEN